MRSNSREIEASLVIWSENPEIVAEQIASLSSIQDYQLLPEDSRTIHDRYLDTSDIRLGIQRLALRIREVGVTQLITLKGPSRLTGGEGEVERLEIEHPWSEEALRSVIKELERRNVKISEQRRDLDYLHPLDAMASLGLQIIQDREIRREVRNIVKGEEKASVLAELAIDYVVYHFGSQDVRHYEVEIEAKRASGSTLIGTVIQSLTATHGPVLRRWNYSKLATGKAIQKMLSENALEGLLDSGNRLRPAAYDKIDNYLKRREI